MPTSRATDPRTSHAAAAAHKASGQLGRNCKLLLQAVTDAPRLTSAEYAVWIQGMRMPGETTRGHRIDRHEAARRLADLKDKGLVRQTGKRKCTASRSGREAVMWDLADPPAETQGKLFSTEGHYD